MPAVALVQNERHAHGIARSKAADELAESVRHVKAGSVDLVARPASNSGNAGWASELDDNRCGAGIVNEEHMRALCFKGIVDNGHFQTPKEKARIQRAGGGNKKPARVGLGLGTMKLRRERCGLCQPKRQRSC